MLDPDALDEVSYDVEEDGLLVRRMLGRTILRRGPWATALFLYEELDRATATFRAPKIAVVRFQKVRGMYRKHSSFPLGSADEAQQLLDVIGAWLPKLTGPDANDDDDAR